MTSTVVALENNPPATRDQRVQGCHKAVERQGPKVEAGNRTEAKRCRTNEKRFDGGKSALDRRTDLGEGRRDTAIGKGNVGLPTRPFWTSRGFGATETIVDTADTGSGFQ